MYSFNTENIHIVVLLNMLLPMIINRTLITNNLKKKSLKNVWLLNYN